MIVSHPIMLTTYTEVDSLQNYHSKGLRIDRQCRRSEVKEEGGLLCQDNRQKSLDLRGCPAKARTEELQGITTKNPECSDTQRKDVSEMGTRKRTRRINAESSAGLQTVDNAVEVKCFSKPAPGNNDNVYKMDSIDEKLAATSVIIQKENPLVV